ncbi:MAG: YigZ family protein [Candidatus Bipolaricaulis sp.]|nr:YigZ family protein [Candidatus Bipolaricaulis sp.]MDD5219114.1 YigZ family protein [Candidatus Bipolaricaulis sp.]MDD5646672.1 YigZ family protein [Candidatus Bipolaricaulis sp.]
MTDAFQTLSAPATAKLIRQRSRFIALVEPTSSLEEIRDRLTDLRKEYHDATHQGSAYRLVGDPISSGSDDDGEPAGSTGLPILRQLEGARLENVLGVVVRYFGGVKLGVGGLARAYADAVAAALASAVIVERHVTVHIQILFPIEVSAGVMSAIHQHEAKVVDIRYDSEGRVTAALAPSRVDAFRRSVTERTGARARLEVRS